ncbi:MAG: oligosaccharide flippase family protein [Oligoflexia bacterium]|nr:oligosaccharide flippase family protein [Oligoflexia bacterium]
MHSLFARYSYKLVSNLFTFILGSITTVVIPKSLGPSDYGNLTFLTTFFTTFISTIDFGSSTWFYTKLSQHPNRRTLPKYYSIIVLTIFIVTFAFIACVFLLNKDNSLWPGQQRKYILIAATYASFAWCLNIFDKMSDAFGLTVYSERFKILQKILGAIAILTLFYLSKITIASIFAYQCSLAMVGSLLMYSVIKSKKKQLFYCKEGLHFKNHSKDMYTYIGPLIFCTLIGFVGSYFDRWILQLLGGGNEQGFFSVAFSIISLCSFFTSSMTPLLIREYSISAAENDYHKISTLFRSKVPLLYTVAAYFSCFLFCHADNVVKIVGGEKYLNAIPALMILSFYPNWQVYGQLSGSLFLATGNTRLYRNLSVFFTLFGIPLTYLLIAPTNKYGLNAGAIGLAVKTILINFLSVNVQLYFNAKMLKLSFSRYFFHQIYIIAILVAIAFLSKKLIMLIPFDNFDNYILEFISSGVVYTCFIFVLIELASKFYWVRENMQEVVQLKNLIDIFRKKLF